MILRDSAYSAVFSCFKSISSSKSIKNFSPWVPRSEKLQCFHGTIFKKYDVFKNDEKNSSARKV